MDFSWIGILKMVVLAGIIIITLWCIYVSQICLAGAILIIGLFGLLWGRSYMEGQFSPERE